MSEKSRRNETAANTQEVLEGQITIGKSRSYAWKTTGEAGAGRPATRKARETCHVGQEMPEKSAHQSEETLPRTLVPA
jgi:hypothetical protein